MSQISFTKVFNGEYLKIVSNYRNTIQSLLKNYDVVIFMARKAICFYEAMLTNKEIIPQDCLILSSRAISFNILKKYSDKKIAIVDDVVVRGTSLKSVIDLLDKNNISADIYVGACEEKFAIEMKNQGNHFLSETFVYLEPTGIYTLSCMILKYIELSMYPINIDQAVFECSGITKKDIETILNDISGVDLTNEEQRKLSVFNKVIYLTYSVGNEIIDEIFKKSILKIRCFISEQSITFVPFVLFPLLNEEELDLLYSYFKNDFADSFINSKNKFTTRENKLKLVSCFWSELLFCDFSHMFNFFANKWNNLDIIRFSEKSDKIYGSKMNQIISNDNRIIKIQELDYESFSFQKTISQVFKVISKNSKKKYLCFDMNKNDFDFSIISYNEIVNEINLNLGMYKEYLISSVIDVFIDRGMIVPVIVFTDNGIERAYKFGEFSKLNRSQIQVFLRMLFEYQKHVNRALGKTEFEKLCVLFFRDAISKNHFVQLESYEDDCYSICYSLYGPRVSTSDNVYKVGVDSTLISEFLEEKLVHLEKIDDSRFAYSISTQFSVEDEELNFFALSFAYLYYELYSWFNDREKSENESEQKVYKMNEYVHSYTQFLTLKSIGCEKKNQFFSLCAELNAFRNLSNDFYLSKNNKNVSIISGINSGIWKYWCYKNSALSKINSDIIQDNIKLAAALSITGGNTAKDKNPALDKIIYLAGNLLFRIAFYIENILNYFSKEKYIDSINSLVTDINEDIKIKPNSTFCQAYLKEFTDEREKIEIDVSNNMQKTDSANWIINVFETLKKEARMILDYCDLYLKSSSASFEFVNKAIVVYDPKENLPSQISGLSEIKLEGVSSKNSCKIYNLSFNDTYKYVLKTLLDETHNIQSVNYVIFDLENYYDGLVLIGNKARGSNLKGIILNQLKDLKESPISSTKKLIYIYSENEKKLELEDYDFIFCEKVSKLTDSKCFKVLLNVAKKEENSMPKIIVNTKSVGVIAEKYEQRGGTVIENTNESALVYLLENRETIYKEIENLIVKVTDEKIAEYLKDACNSLSKKDTNGFNLKLKKAFEIGKDYFINISSSILYQYMVSNGIVPA